MAVLVQAIARYHMGYLDKNLKQRVYVQCVTYENICSHTPANTVPCPAPLPDPPLTKRKKWVDHVFGFFVILVYVHNFTGIPFLPPLHLTPPPQKKKNKKKKKHLFPDFGFFVKIHSLERERESLILELYDLYFRSYSLMIIFWEEMWIVLNIIQFVDGFYEGSCLRLYLFRPPSHCIQFPQTKAIGRAPEHSWALNNLGWLSSCFIIASTIRHHMQGFVFQNGWNGKDFVHLHPTVPLFNRAIKDSYS